jgi:hypothetical protein
MKVKKLNRNYKFAAEGSIYGFSSEVINFSKTEKPDLRILGPDKSYEENINKDMLLVSNSRMDKFVIFYNTDKSEKELETAYYDIFAEGYNFIS